MHYQPAMDKEARAADAKAVTDAEAENKANAEASAKAKVDQEAAAAEAKAKAEAEAKAKSEAEAKAKAEAEAKAKAEAEAKAKVDQEAAAAEAKAKAEAEAKAKSEAEAKAKAEAEAKAKAEAKVKAPVQASMTEKTTLQSSLKPGTWKVGLFGCCKTPVRAFLGHCCPCLATYKMLKAAAPFNVGMGIFITAESTLFWCIAMWLIGGSSFLLPVALPLKSSELILPTGVVFVILAAVCIMGIEQKYRIQENILATFSKTLFCFCCFQIQVLRHVEQVGPVALAPEDDEKPFEAKSYQAV